jgi:hypothetical protein
MLLRVTVEARAEGGQIAEVLSSLPAESRPIFFGHGESDKAGRIDDTNAFERFLKKSQSGFILRRSGCSYGVRMAAGKPLICDCFLDVSPAAAKTVLMHLARARPVFGFACEPKEYEERNRVFAQVGTAKIESWVGRDTTRYLPGFYWLTLISQTVLESARLDLKLIREYAVAEISPEEGVLVFQFYDAPQDWRSNLRMSELYSRTDSVFKIEDIRPQVAAAGDLASLRQILANWRSRWGGRQHSKRGGQCRDPAWRPTGGSREHLYPSHIRGARQASYCHCGMLRCTRTPDLGP